MKQYKGLNVPERRPTDRIDATSRQMMMCNMVPSEQDCGLDCGKCIFYTDNLDVFMEWEKKEKK